MLEAGMLENGLTGWMVKIQNDSSDDGADGIDEIEMLMYWQPCLQVPPLRLSTEISPNLLGLIACASAVLPVFLRKKLSDLVVCRENKGCAGRGVKLSGDGV